MVLDKEICRFLLFLSGIILISCTETPNKVKNVLLLVADDAGLEMGAYLNAYCQTPNLDALARKGLIFNNAFTSVSSCSPSRAQILTGLATHQNGMYGLHHGVHHFNVFESVQSLPNILRKNGYFTGIIGKKHVGSKNNFQFDYEQTEENHSINQIGRNITLMKLYMREFLEKAKLQNVPFFLVVAFHDPHRCGHITPQYGEFCELWGSGQENMGIIPDWTPIYYDWRNLPRHQYLQDTETMRKELAAQYMTISRLDQGVGLMIKELEMAEFNSSTLVMYTSDNGPPFPVGRTNFYEYGIREPLIIYSPEDGVRRHSVSYAMTSLLDIFPTVLDVFNINSSQISSNNDVYYTGRSLLPILKKEPGPDEDVAIFGSHVFHEVTMTYPMRMIRTKFFKLIHNINFQIHFPIDQDLYLSPTFQEILNTSRTNYPVLWFKNLPQYYNRNEWELYDVNDEKYYNLAYKQEYQFLRKKLADRLYEWMRKTNDPWLCAPHGVLQNQGPYKDNPTCMSTDVN